MQKDRTYHESAVQYNEGIAEYAANLAESLVHPEIKKWCLSVSKQHAFHGRRHKAALKKFDDLEQATVEGLLQEDNVISAKEFHNKLAESQDTDGDSEAESPNAFDSTDSVLPPSAVENTPDPEAAAEAIDAGVAPVEVYEVETDVVTEVTQFDASQPHDLSESYPGGKCNEKCEGGHPILMSPVQDEEN